MTTDKKSITGINKKLILLRIKILRPSNKATKNTVTALLSKNHLKNQDKVKCFSSVLKKDKFSLWARVQERFMN